MSRLLLPRLGVAAVQQARVGRKCCAPRGRAVAPRTYATVGPDFGGWGDLADGNTDVKEVERPRRPPREDGDFGEPRRDSGRRFGGDDGGGGGRSFGGRGGRSGPISRGGPRGGDGRAEVRNGDWCAGAAAQHQRNPGFWRPVAHTPHPAADAHRGRASQPQVVLRLQQLRQPRVVHVRAPSRGGGMAPAAACQTNSVRLSRPLTLALAYPRAPALIALRPRCPRCAAAVARRKCGAARPEGAGPPPGGEFRRERPSPMMRPGDWACNDCRFANFASRETCYKCEVCARRRFRVPECVPDASVHLFDRRRAATLPASKATATRRAGGAASATARRASAASARAATLAGSAAPLAAASAARSASATTARARTTGPARRAPSATSPAAASASSAASRGRDRQLRLFRGL
jgi:hypothetical protein